MHLVGFSLFTLYSDEDLTFYHVIILIHYQKCMQVVILGNSSGTDVEHDKAVLPSARSCKNSSHGHVTTRSLFLVGADVAVNNTKLFSAAMKMQQWIYTTLRSSLTNKCTIY